MPGDVYIYFTDSYIDALVLQFGFMWFLAALHNKVSLSKHWLIVERTLISLSLRDLMQLIKQQKQNRCVCIYI